jgi:hypothetical protein
LTPRVPAGIVLLGVAVFRESLSRGNVRLAPAAIGLALAFAGVVLLSLYEAMPAAKVANDATKNTSPK